MAKIKWVCLLPICLLISCLSMSYLTRYETYLAKSDPPKSFQFKDTHFEFNFLPQENGIVFSIRNTMDVPAFLEWDRCYFIDPYGNSSKALNTDIIHESAETKDKEKYESILPPQAAFTRFTTSVLNMKNFVNINFNEIRYLNTSTTIGSVIKIENIRCYNFPEYSPDSGEASLKDIKNFVTNSNLGLGLAIKLNSPDTIVDYRFDFRFKTVKIWKAASHYDEKVAGTVHWDTTLFKSASEENGWIWK